MTLDHTLLVGALTSKPYAFTARSWELKNTDSLDVFDSVNSNIKISTRGSSVLRILPKINEKINEEWITDKARFSYDALKFQRILHCYAKVDHRFVQINWPKVFGRLYAKKTTSEFYKTIRPVKPLALNFFVGSFSDLETLSFVRNFESSTRTGSFSVANTAFHRFLDLDLRSNFLFAKNLDDLENINSLLLIGCNPRLEAPALNLKIRKNVLFKDLRVSNIGFNTSLTYKVTNLGSGIKKIVSLLEGRSPFARKLDLSSNLIICGSSLLQTKTGSFLYTQLKQFFTDVVLLTSESSAINYFELGGAQQPSIWSKKKNVANVNWLLDEDKSIFLDKNRFNIYLGHHGDFNFQKSDLILPSTLFSEKNSTYVNYQGFIQKTKFVDSSMLGKDIRDDLVFMKTLVGPQGNNSNKNTHYYKQNHQLVSYAPQNLGQNSNSFSFIHNHSLYYYMKDFYRNDSISRNSPIMALTSNRLNYKKSAFKR